MVVAKLNGDWVSKLKLTLVGADTLHEILLRTIELLGENSSAKYVAFVPLKPTSAVAPLIWSLEEIAENLDYFFIEITQQLRQKASVKNKNILVSDLKKDSNLKSYKEEIKNLSLKSVEAIFFNSKNVEQYALCLFYAQETKGIELLGEERLEDIYSILKQYFENLNSPVKQEIKNESNKDEEFYKRLVQNSEAVIFSVDPENNLQFISKRAMDFFGIIPEERVANTAISWLDLMQRKDYPRVEKITREMQQQGVSFEVEFRVVNQITLTERYLLTKLVPVRNENQEIIAWDGFAIDITAKKQTQDALEIQSKKVRALYAVSSAIRGYLEPGNIASRGLSAICDATAATSGFCFLYGGSKGQKLNLVAHNGFAPGTAEQFAASFLESNLFNLISQKNQALVITDLKNDPRTKDIAIEENISSALFVPVVAEDEIFGIIGIFHREISKFDGADLMLVTAAASQIALAARQSTLFASYRRHTKNLTALYRISHELSFISPLEDIFTQAFAIIRDELGLKRLWLGLVDGGAKRIIGQAAYGPGWKKKLVEIDVEITDPTNPINQVIEEKKVLLVNEPEKLLGPVLLRRFFSHFALKSLVLAPLVSRGQILGVLAVQPSSQDARFEEEDLALLSNLANEIATLILTKRLESRINEGEKMRSIGLLAAGIAHNFNNLLQAVLGQASLLEMGKSNETQVEKAAKIISEAAMKGAGLVRQLLSFANIDTPQTQTCQINDIINSEVKNWNGLLAANQQLKLSLKTELPRAIIDPRQFIRIMNILIANAADSMKEKGGLIQIFSDTLPTEQELVHFEVPLGNYIRVGVRDRGVGMDDETKKRCFEPFFTTKNVDPGSGLSISGAGLGLATAYALARKNGGRLVVDSRLGQGSVLTIYLPIEEGAGSELGKEKREVKEKGEVSIEV